MARQLITAGHRRIAFAQVQPRSSITDAMVAGAREVIAAAGLRPLHVIESGTRDWADPLEAMQKACAAAGESTGLICTTGPSAFAAIRALRLLGRRVPDDVSVIGSADDPLLAYADPAITVTTVDFSELLGVAFKIIAAGPTRPSSVVHVPIKVVQRESVQPPEE